MIGHGESLGASPMFDDDKWLGCELSAAANGIDIRGGGAFGQKRLARWEPRNAHQDNLAIVQVRGRHHVEHEAHGSSGR